MRYKRGNLVEMLIRDEVPYHSWRRVQVVSGNKHTYTVRYVYPGFTNQWKIERVSTKFIRPCPPPLEMSEWSSGDVVEVFHNHSWKMAVVVKVFSCNLFLVRLVGSFLELEASKSELRVRQSWQNDEWIVIGKVHINSEFALCNDLSKHSSSSGSKEKQKDAKRDFYMKRLQFGAENENMQESHIVSTKTLKRGSHCFSQDEVNEVTPLKFKITQKEGKRLRVLITSPENESEKDAYTYYDNRATHLYTPDVERKDQCDAYRNAIDDSSVTSSVGSCSISRYSDYEDIESRGSDAESVIQGDYQEDISLRNKELAAEIHRLELDAYRSTIEALHASGPLTWEKETMVTNLRMLLHISNDEHLTELKNLISTANTIHSR